MYVLVSNINLTAWREERRKEQLNEFVTVLAVVAVVAVMIWGGVRLYYGTLISVQSERLQYVDTEIAKLEKKIEELKTLQEEKERLLARIRAIEELQGKRPMPVKMLDELVRVMPDSASISSFSEKEGRISIKGVAESNASISSLMRGISGSEVITAPDLREITKGLVDTEKLGKGKAMQIVAYSEQAASKPGNVEVSQFELNFSLVRAEEDDEELE